jgi:hypothetical protein
MKLSKFLYLLFFTTCLSLLYVYQQTEVFRLAYVGQKRQAIMQDLLDKNTILRYNVSRNASLIHIGDKVSDDAEYELPESYRLVRLRPSKEELKAKSVNRETIFSNLFGIKAQAEARTLNP